MQKVPAYLISVNDNGESGFYEVTDLGVHVQSKQVVFSGIHVDDYEHLNLLLEDIGMKWGMVEWLTQQLETRGNTYQIYETSNRALRLLVEQRDREVSRLREEVARLEQVCDTWWKEYVDET